MRSRLPLTSTVEEATPTPATSTFTIMAQRRSGSARIPRHKRRRLRWASVLVWSAVIIVSTTAILVWLRPSPPDDFYTFVADVSAFTPGEVLRYEEFATGIPPGIDAWRLLYRTTDTHGDPAVGSALLLVPDGPPLLELPEGPARMPPGVLPGMGYTSNRGVPAAPKDPGDDKSASDTPPVGDAPSAGAPQDVAMPATNDSDRPLLVVGHGSTGADRSCAPSLSARPLASLPEIDDALAAGWAVVAPDYLGLGTEGPHPYLVGTAAAHAMLDAARAAEQLVAIDATRIAAWGFSQGGHAALFAAERQPVYAPDVPLAAVVALAPPTLLSDLITHGQGTVLGTLVVSTTAVTWSEVYPELELTDVVLPESIEDAQQVARRCLDPASLPVSFAQSIQLRGAMVAPGEPGTEDWVARMDENTPEGGVEAPVLVIQAADDVLIDSSITMLHLQDRCRRGDVVDLVVLDGAGHFTLVGRAGRLVTEWTADRFSGRPFVSCDFDLTRPDEDGGSAGQTEPSGLSRGDDYDPDAPLRALASLTEDDLRDRRLPTIRRLPPPVDDSFAWELADVSEEVLARSTWHSGCPVGPDDLRHVMVSHWGFEGGHHTGEMLVHRDAAEALVAAFGRLHELRYPIEELRIVESWELDLPPTGHGNTSTAFVCRSTVGGSRWSEHAYGLAVDINPFHNPYLRGSVVLPELAGAYLDRSHHRPGMIQPGDEVVQAFASIGWRWGGNWGSAKDWMHFSATGR